jgi:Skp family chaperone for outer membrane proteins
MKRTERFVIYSLLAALAAVNGVFVLSSTGRTAFAEASAWLADLGPADSLKLSDGDKELVLRNKKSRLSWGEGEFRQTYTIAFIDISKVLNPLMDAAALKEDREKLDKELQGTETDYKSKLDAFGEEIKNLDRQSPEGQAKLAEARKVYQEYMEWGQKSMEQRNKLHAQQLEKSYKELVSAVDVVSEKLGVDIVLRFIPTEKDFTAEDPESALTEIRLRTAVKYPNALDITSEVMEELSIKSTS